MASKRKGSTGPPTNMLDMMELVWDNRTQLQRIRVCIVCEVYKYHENKCKLAEACDEIFNVMKAEELSRPHLFQHFIAAAFDMKGKDADLLPKFGHIFAFSFLKVDESGRDEILKGLAEYCGAIARSWSSWSMKWGHISNLWIVFADMLSLAILHPLDLPLEGAPPTLKDFAGIFVNADKDIHDPNSLFAIVIRRLRTLSKEQQANRIQRCIVREVYKYNLDNGKLREACAGILDIMQSEDRIFTNAVKLQKPSLALIFQMFVVAAADLGRRGIPCVPAFGSILTCDLLFIPKKGKHWRNRILRGLNFTFAESHENIKFDECFFDTMRSVLSNTILPTPGLFTIEEFKDLFVVAAYTSLYRKKNPVSLFVQVLKRLVEEGVKVDFEWTFNDIPVDMDKLIDVLKATKTTFHRNMYDILAQSNCLDTTPSLTLLFDSYGRTLDMLSAGDLAEEYRLKRMKMCIVREVYKYNEDKSKLDEACTEILNMHCVFKNVKADWFEKPSLALLFQVFIAAAEDEAANSKDSERICPTFGHVLACCLLKLAKKGRGYRERIFKGIAKLCGEVAESSDGERIAKFCAVVGKVLSNAILPTPGLLETRMATGLAHFKGAFLNAANARRKPYALFVEVLKGLAEIRGNDDYCKALREATRSKELFFGANVLCRSIIKEMDGDKLIEELEEIPIFHRNLYEILRDSGCPHMTSSLSHLFDSQVSVASFFRLFNDCY